MQYWELVSDVGSTNCVKTATESMSYGVWSLPLGVWSNEYHLDTPLPPSPLQAPSQEGPCRLLPGHSWAGGRVRREG